MKTIYKLLTVLSAAAVLTSCHDWLTEQAPGKTDIDDFFTSAEAAKQAVNAAYTPLMWEFSNTYCPEWFVGDVCSDDSIKGGESLSDQSSLYDMSNFQTTANNESLLDFYRFQFQGIQRANLALERIGDMTTDDSLSPRLKTRLLGECRFLRAYFYFRLVRIFGGVPRVEAPIYSSDNWKQPRASAESIYELILSDLEAAEQALWNRSEYSSDDLGRATKGAAQAMLLKVNLYCHDYAAARTWGEKFFREQASEYSLCADFMDNFYFEGENGPESVFEIQYMAEGTSDYGNGIPNGGAGATRGTFTSLLTRPRSSLVEMKPGWGFNKPSSDLYNEFEEGDPRREYTIFIPLDSQIETPAQEIHYGNRNISRKYLYELRTAKVNEDGTITPKFPNFEHDTRCPLNRKEIRLADVKLLYAEACLECGDAATAKTHINDIRRRVGLGEVEATTETLRHERRVELAMEGHRWFDLCRWGIVGQTMRAYKAKYTGDVSRECKVDDDGNVIVMDSHEGNDMRDFRDGVHELFPIPWDELLVGDLEQNPGY